MFHKKQKRLIREDEPLFCVLRKPLRLFSYKTIIKKALFSLFYKKKLSIFAPQKGKGLFPNLANLAEIAQLVEHFIRNERVAGSSPAFGSNLS